MSFTVKPTASALKALQDALEHKRGLPVTATLTFQSSLGGNPTTHTQSLTIKPKKKSSHSTVPRTPTRDQRPQASPTAPRYRRAGQASAPTMAALTPGSDDLRQCEPRLG